MSTDYYQILGVDRSAAQDDIKKAYKKLALKHHPDRNPGDAKAVEQFKLVSEAYRVLGDPERRRRYDRTGETGEEGPALHEVDIATVAEYFESIFGDLIGRRRKRGKDLRKEVDLTFEEAAFGVEKKVSIARSVTCTRCRGSGAAPGAKLERCAACDGRGEVRFQQGLFSLTRPCRRCSGKGATASEPCPACGGTGVTVREEELPVRFPPGTETGSKRTVRGYGAEAADGTGDLHVYAKVGSHPLFERHGHDVLCTLPVTFPQAALGDEVEVPTLDGAVSMKIKAGTQSGQTYKLRGKGVPRLGGTRGDQLVRVEVEVPKSLTPKQEALIKQLADELGVDVHPQQRTFLDRLRQAFS